MDTLISVLYISQYLYFGEYPFAMIHIVHVFFLYFLVAGSSIRRPAHSSQAA